MKQLVLTTLAILLLVCGAEKAMAFGHEGHKIISRMAYDMLDAKTKQKVTTLLAGMTPEDAGNWMDDVRGDPYYKYMSRWHYINIAPGKQYDPKTTDNIIWAIEKASNTIKTGTDIAKRKEALMMLFHLVGDLHQPLHTGYESDRGGNEIDVRMGPRTVNLHSAWDESLLRANKIDMAGCRAVYKRYTAAKIATLTKGTTVDWMNQSRTLLGTVYSFKNNTLDKAYLDRSKPVMEAQLVAASIRLSFLLKNLLR